MEAKQKKCKHCKNLFTPFLTTQKVCSPECALELVKTKNRKVERTAYRKETKERKAKLKTKAMWLNEAQTAFNKFIRLRDYAESCISCQREHKGQYHAGHYKSRGSSPELRFEEDNCHKQCAPCNNHLSGNQTEYRINLINKIGLTKVEKLEGPNDPKNYTIEDIELIKKTYNKKARELEK